MAACGHMQTIIALYFELEIKLKIYNLEARSVTHSNNNFQGPWHNSYFRVLYKLMKVKNVFRFPALHKTHNP